MIRKWLAVALFACSCQAVAQQETSTLEASSSHYIRDDLYIFMHTGPGRNYRILGSVEAGTPVTVLDTDNESEYTQVSDNQDRQGWVESKFVTTTMSQSEQLPMLREKVEQHQAQMQSVQQENAQLRKQLSDARQQVTQLTTQTEKQVKELATLTSQVESADRDELVTWFTRGGIVAGAGILLGILIAYMPKKRNRSKEWM